MIFPARTMTAPTAGFGLVWPNPRRASARAARMKSSSCISSLINLAQPPLNPELHAVSLSLREKQRLYHSLAQLVRQGIPFPAALNKLAPGARGDTRRLIEAARKSLASGH